MKKPLLHPKLLFPFVFTLFISVAYAQTKKSKHFGISQVGQKNMFSVYLAVNYNFSNASRPPLNFWAFYNYNEAPYAEFNRYYPLLNKLNGVKGIWTLQPSIEIGTRVLESMGNAIYGAELVFTYNSSNWVATSTASGAKAELHFQGNELRLMFKPTFGAQINRFTLAGQFILGLGFNKNYNTHLLITEPNGQSTRLTNENDRFYNVDFSVGLGALVEYAISSSIRLGLQYAIYSVNTSPSINSGFLDFTPLVNGFWNNNLGLRVAYQF